MSTLALILIILAVLMILPGLFFKAVEVLLWIGIVLAVVAAITWIVDWLRGRDRTG